MSNNDEDMVLVGGAALTSEDQKKRDDKSYVSPPNRYQQPKQAWQQKAPHNPLLVEPSLLTHPLGSIP